MKTLGIIGGLGPESTLDYYRRLVAAYRERTGDGTYPRVIINCVDLSIVVGHMNARRHAELAVFLVDEIKKLAAAGVELLTLRVNDNLVIPVVAGAVMELALRWAR